MDSWKKVKLGDIIIKMPKSEHPAKDALDEGKYPFFTNSASDKKFFINEFDYDEPIILANTGGKAYFKYCDEKCSASRDLYIFKCIPGVNTKFLYYILKTLEDDINENGFAGAALKHLQKDYLHNKEISIPDYSEQVKIVDILSKFDELISVNEFKASNLIKAKTQLMNDIFSGGLRSLPDINPEDFVQSNWVKVKLGDIGECVRGMSYKKENVVDEEDSVTLIMRSNNINENGILNYREGLQFIDKECKANQILQKNDIVICMANGSPRLVGKSSIYDGGYSKTITCGAFCSIYRSSNPLVRFLMQSTDYKRQVDVLMHGGVGAINNLKASDIENMEFQIPPTLQEQKQIASLLSSYDELIQLNHDKLSTVNKMKAQLMTQVFAERERELDNGQIG